MTTEEKTNDESKAVLEDDEVTLESKSPEGNNENGFASLENRVEQLESELTQAKEQALRAAAEAQNIRRRAEQDVEKAHKYGQEKFVSDILTVADNLERAVESANNASEGGDLAAITEGVQLTLKSLLDALAKHKVEAIEPVGEPFDPELHQAMTMVEDANVEPNTVINVFQKGYTLNGRLLRPAMVVVSKAASQ